MASAGRGGDPEWASVVPEPGSSSVTITVLGCYGLQDLASSPGHGHHNSLYKRNGLGYPKCWLGILQKLSIGYRLEILTGLTECSGTNKNWHGVWEKGILNSDSFCWLQFSLTQNGLPIRPCVLLAPRGLWTGWGRGSPPTEVQDGVGGEHAQDDEGSGNGHSHVLGGVGPEHIWIHSSSESQEATDAYGQGQGEKSGPREGEGGPSTPDRSVGAA